ncbi:P22 phage major capsid protein family protein [Yersinia enterocolitica]|uniref:P22 phage major capsid protein family protein n=1 Tax=Yersinia enterocolitica TaxID=630 RepID=UPI002867657D|nr:P22 coat - protein 5 family protein [Yersinia enterocolitica]HDL7945783.1 P22 coat - protein 5 family protein [Yersinia enterocolitica]HDV5960259.1 P22 coat - protein 5 family protein [Yersinia enterocolitica]HEB4793576.1 P22 coat - protein 5 family protein [Yersinia enterocolitica]HEI6705648.1 P22 coat - protein 5 family protein [Yersinia enterocolitica]
MSNTLTSLIPDLYASLDVVSRELAGFIPSVTLDASAERASLNQPIRIPITPASQAEDVSPGQLPPDDGDQTVGNTPFTITKSRMVPFRWTGEEQKGINTGPGYAGIRRDQIAQAMRTLVNEIEVDLGKLAFLSSRASGTAGTTPFATNLGDTAQVRKILSDNGAPLSDLQCVIDTTSGASLRTLAQLTKANEAGTTALRAQGTLLELHGFQLRESAGVAAHTPGTGASYVTNGALAIGATTIPAQTGTGTILAGDVVTIGAYKYVVTTALSGGSFAIGAPGLRAAVASGATITGVSAFTANFAFSRSAIVLATRAPALPEEGDMASDRIMLQDPRTGMAFEVSMYKQYRRVRYEIAAAWGCQNIKPAHTAILLG